MKHALLFLIIISIVLIITVYNNQPKLNSTLVYLSKYPYNTNDKPNACIIVLLRNQNLERFIQTIIKIEQNFNNRYNYPYILFNDVEFDDNFKNSIKNFTNSSIEFVKIAKEAWGVPSWIDPQKLNESLVKLKFSIGYRNMCRFFSGFFYKENATLKYDMYMRLDLDSDIFCPSNVDPFQVFQNNPNLIYGFALGSPEAYWTLPTLWDTIKNWLNKDDYLNKMPKSESFLDFVSMFNKTGLVNNTGDLKDFCTFYNNFEVGRFSMFRNQQYDSYFNHLDKAGGFYYERWGNNLIFIM